VSSVQQLECREFEYRQTIRTRATTLYILVLDGEILRPARRRRSRSGAHGEDVYCLTEEQWRRVWVVGLYQSNSGRRHAEFSENIPEEVRRVIERTWMHRELPISDLEHMIQILNKIYTLKSE
jgi:hypothetical protein